MSASRSPDRLVIPPQSINHTTCQQTSRSQRIQHRLAILRNHREISPRRRVRVPPPATSEPSYKSASHPPYPAAQSAASATSTRLSCRRESAWRSPQAPYPALSDPCSSFNTQHTASLTPWGGLAARAPVCNRRNATANAQRFHSTTPNPPPIPSRPPYSPAPFGPERAHPIPS